MGQAPSYSQRSITSCVIEQKKKTIAMNYGSKFLTFDQGEYQVFTKTQVRIESVAGTYISCCGSVWFLEKKNNIVEHNLHIDTIKFSVFFCSRFSSFYCKTI